MKRILIVDDKEANLYLLRALLQGHGYAVDEARNGVEALAIAKSNPPQLIVSDLLMPVMDGYALLRKWKEDPALGSRPFVVYTATYTDPRDERLALALGADAFLIKPAEPEAFMACLHDVLAKAERGEMIASTVSRRDKADLLEAQTEVLVRKLEKKADQLEKTNRELLEEIVDRKRAEGKLRESEERFRELAESIQEVFWMADASLEKILYVSPAYEKVWGRSCASLYASPWAWLEAVHPEDRERIAHAVRTKQEQGQYHEVYRIVRPDGSLRWIRDRGFAVRDDSGQMVRIVGTAEDITERHLLEEQVRQSHKMEAIGQLAAGIAHDFNNIVAVILGNAEIGQSKLTQAEGAYDNLEEIKKASDRAQSLVKQILTFSRQQPQARKIISLGPTLRESAKFLSAVLPSQVELVVSVDETAPTVLADATQIYQIVTNLCTNAWHALEENPGRIEVTVRAAKIEEAEAKKLGGIRPGRAAILSIRDTGKGMDEATLDRIFEPFFTTKSQGKGTGLGLSVVQGIVQGHDGAITVSSNLGQGTHFDIYFPATETGKATPVIGNAPLATRLHLLYLDDEEVLVSLAEKEIASLGYRFTGFTSASEAIQAFSINSNLFDLVITDLNMPGTSGLQVATELLKIRPKLPIALCTGHITDELMQRSQNTGIADLLFKPGHGDAFGRAVFQIASNIV